MIFDASSQGMKPEDEGWLPSAEFRIEVRDFKVPYTFMPHESLVARYEVREDPLGGYAVVSLKPNAFASAYQRALVLKGRIPDEKQAEEWLERFKRGQARPTFA